MPRKIIPNNPNFPYHIWTRSNNKEWFEIDLELLWNIYQDYLFLIVKTFEVEIFSFVLMNNHFHMLAKFPKNNMSDVMEYFLRETSRVISFELKRENHIYKSRYGRSMIESEHYFSHAYKYIYRNPVEVGICKHAEEYKFSSLHGLMGFKKMWIPLSNDEILFDGNIMLNLNWLNQPYKLEDKKTLANAMKKCKFQFRKDHNNKPHRFEIEIS